MTGQTLRYKISTVYDLDPNANNECILKSCGFSLIHCLLVLTLCVEVLCCRSLFCHEMFCVLSSFAIISLRKREFVALL